MRKGFALLSSFWFGAAMGAAAVVLAFLAAKSIPGTVSPIPDNLLYHYQTLIGGAGALIAAIVTVWVIWKQIEQQYELEEGRRLRQSAAARTALPDALDDLCKYAQGCARQLAKIRDYRSVEDMMYPTMKADESFVRVPPGMLREFPQAPPSVISVLSRCVESADESAAREISLLGATLQIQEARLQAVAENGEEGSDGNRLILFHSIDNLILDAVDLHARASNLFGFGRSGYNRTDFAPTQRNMSTALFLCDIDDDEYPNIWDAVRRNYPEGKPPA